MADSLFERLYETEWQRRSELLGAANLPLGILALLGSALVVILKEYESGGTFLDAVFWCLFAISCSAFGVAAYMLVRSFYGYVYEQIP